MDRKQITTNIKKVSTNLKTSTQPVDLRQFKQDSAAYSNKDKLHKAHLNAHNNLGLINLISLILLIIFVVLTIIYIMPKIS